MKVRAKMVWQPGEHVQITIEDVPLPHPKWVDSDAIKILHVDGAENGTLFDLLVTNRRSGPSGEEITLVCNTGIIGELSPSDSYRQIDLNVRGCSSWFGITGFDFSDFANAPGERQTLVYEAVPKLSWEVAKGLRIEYDVGLKCQLNRSPMSEANLKEYSTIRAISEEPRTLKEMSRNAMKVIAYLEFVLREAILIERVWLWHVPDDNEALEVATAWDQKGNVGHSTHAAFFYPVVAKNLGDHLSRWFELYEQLPLALDIYRDYARRKVAQSEFAFFGITSALESLHRMLFDQDEPPKCEKCGKRDEMSLLARLRDIVKKYSGQLGKMLTKDDCDSIAATRNYLAHQTEGLRVRAVPNEDLYYVYRRLSVVFEIMVLNELPFDKQVLGRIVSHRLEQIDSGWFGDFGFS